MLLARRLRHCGFDVHMVSYPTVNHTLEQSAGYIQRYVDTLNAEVIHFVGHSLGGIVARALFYYYPRQRPGRLVTIASPHGGSHVGRMVSRCPVGYGVLGKSMQQVLDAVPQQWPLPAKRDVGVIRGSLPIGLGRIFRGLSKPNDGVLTLTEASLAGATDEITLAVAHTGMLFAPAVARQVCRFLATGRFQR